MNYIDTHCHLDGEEFKADCDAVIERARQAGCTRILVPAINLASINSIANLCSQHPDICLPMIGLHPEDVNSEWQSELDRIKQSLADMPSPVAVGEIGLDFYWSREFEQEQLQAFEEQVKWAVDLQLPLMIHCRKAQNELINILKRYARAIKGGVFHCFTGNGQEARQLLEFPQFMLGIGGVLTFKKSHLPEVLPSSVPLERIVLETDAPYMAPTPLRGTRNEPSYIPHIISKLAEAYQVSADEVASITTANARRIFAGI